MKQSQPLHNLQKAGILGLCASAIMGIPLMAKDTSAQTIVGQNCPGLYYQEPWESIVEPPVGCAPNERSLYGESADNNEIDYVETPTEVYPNPVRQPVRPVYPNPVISLPDSSNEVITSIKPQSGTINIRLENDTNATVSYQLVGHTGDRWLMGEEQVYLTGIPVPVTLTLVREDDGLLKVIPIGSDTDELNITIEENLTFDDTQGVVRVQENGNVLIN